MDSIDDNTPRGSAKLSLPRCRPFYTKALPDVQTHRDTGITSVDSAGIGNWEVPPIPNQSLAENMNSYRGFMQRQNSWHLDDSLTLGMDKFIDKNLAECRKASAEKMKIEKAEEPEVILDSIVFKSPQEEDEPELHEQELIIHEEVPNDLNKTIDEDRVVTHYSQEGTPIDQKPRFAGLHNAPKRQFGHLPRIYQPPKSLFEKKYRLNACEKGAWEKLYPVGNEKYITVSQFRGRKSVHVRQFYNDRHNKIRPTQKGLVLSPSEWNNLTLLVKDIDDDLNL